MYFFLVPIYPYLESDKGFESFRWCRQWSQWKKKLFCWGWQDISRDIFPFLSLLILTENRTVIREISWEQWDISLSFELYDCIKTKYQSMQQYKITVFRQIEFGRPALQNTPPVPPQRGKISLVTFGLVWFYGISTIVVYLMPSQFLYK